MQYIVMAYQHKIVSFFLRIGRKLRIIQDRFLTEQGFVPNPHEKQNEGHSTDATSVQTGLDWMGASISSINCAACTCMSHVSCRSLRLCISHIKSVIVMIDQCENLLIRWR